MPQQASPVGQDRNSELRTQKCFIYMEFHLQEQIAAIQMLIDEAFGKDVRVSEVFNHIQIDPSEQLWLSGHDLLNIRLFSFALFAEDRSQFPRKVGHVILNPPSHISVIIHWSWLVRILARADQETRNRFAHANYVQAMQPKM